MLKRVFLAAFVSLVPSLAFGQAVNWGDYQDSNQTIYLYFGTVGTTGEAATLASGTLEIYEDGSATQITTAETLDNDFDSITGYHQVAIDLNDAGFETGKTYTVILTGGTVGSLNVAGRIVGVFSVGRYADIDATAGVVNANITQISGDSTAADNAEAFYDGTGYAGTGNTIPTVTTVTDGVNVTQFGGTNGTFSSGRPEVNASHWGGTAAASANVRADVRQFLGSAITEASASNIATNFSTFWNNEDATGDTLLSNVTDIKTRTDRIPNVAAGASGGLFIAGTNAATTVTGSLTTTFTGNLSGSVGSIATGGIAATSFAANSITAAATAADFVTEIGGASSMAWADLVADNDDIAGSFGKAIADILVDTGTTLPDAIDDVTAAIGGTATPRINSPPSPGFTTQVSRRADGTYKCTKPIRLTAGAVDGVYVFIDMAPLFGATDFVQEVGSATFSAGSVTQGEDNGPRDTYAVLELDGTADATSEVTVPVTMETGTTIDVVFDLEVLE
jgi:hypothetical protein